MNTLSKVLFLISLSIGALFIPTGFYSASAQSLENLSEVKVDELSNDQILKIKQELASRNMSMMEFERIAQARGMSPTELTKLRRRLNEVNVSASSDDNTESSDMDSIGTPQDPFELLTFQRNKFEETDSMLAEEGKLAIFGADLFRSKTLTFAPSINIPTPAEYVLAAGDEVLISIWGAAQMEYQLTVRKDGSIFINDLGPIQVSGLSFENAEKRIIARLSEIYSGLKATPPNTYSSVSLGRTRSINVSVTGEAENPGTFTLPSPATILNALYVSGGPKDDGSFRSVKVLRDNKVVADFDLYDFLLGNSVENNIVLQDQDIIRLEPYNVRFSISGAVKRPAIYEAKKNETVAEALAFAGGFSTKAYRKSITVFRNNGIERQVLTLTEPEWKKESIMIGDSLVVSEFIDRYANRVEINGAVWKPGIYSITDTSTVKGLLAKAEGLKGDAFPSRSIIFRTKPNLETEVISFNLSDDLSNIKLLKDDIVQIPSIFDLREEYFISVKGAVNNAGEFPFSDNMTLEDVILMADGFTDDAISSRIEVSRRVKEKSNDSRSKIAELFTFTVGKNLEISEETKDFVIQPFDIVYIRKNPNYEVQKQIVVQGEINYPGAYTIESKKERISDIITRSGGLTDDAYPEGARLIRSANDAGPIGIDLPEILDNPGSKYDFFLEDGDRLIVPTELQTVKVRGEVLYPISMRFDKSNSFRKYIAQSGGYTDEARKKKVYVVYADGTVDTRKGFLFFTRYPKIEPGAEIIVPAKPKVEPMSRQERIGILSAIVSMASVIAITVTNVTR